MKNTILIIVILLIVCPSAFGQSDTSFDAKITLDIEKQEGIAVNEEHYKFLDTILKATDAQIVFPKEITKNEALKICKKISVIFQEEFNITYNPTELLSRGLESRHLDCNYFSILFYTMLAKIHNYNVSVVLTPGHMFIRWYLPDGTYFNYETTQTIEITDDEYISNFNISQHALSNKMYMTPLTDKQIIATNYVEIAISVSDSGFTKQLELCDRSLMNYNNYVNAWLTKGEVFALQNNFNEAITCFHKVLELDSLNYRTFDYIGSLYSRQNKSTDAITYFTKAISCNPNDPQPYMHRAEEYLKTDKVDEAMADFESATSFLNKFTIFKFLVNYIKLTELEQKIMEAYLKKYDNNK